MLKKQDESLAQTILPTDASCSLRTLERFLLHEIHLDSKAESQAVLRRLLGHCFALTDADWILNPTLTLSSTVRSTLLDAIERLQQYEPIQYILGIAYFADSMFHVTPDVLIPRTETEEWVAFLRHAITPPTTVLDIGTGSGCIAITLKKYFPTASVEAIDCSQAALRIAESNAQKLGVAVQYIQADILTQPLPPRRWSLIVSNPPYVRMQEKKFMKPNVLNHEPHLALFVEDADPLVFYKRIIQLARAHLEPKGTLCIEINEVFGKKVVDLLHRTQFQEVVLHKDLYAKERWVMAIR